VATAGILLAMAACASAFTLPSESKLGTSFSLPSGPLCDLCRTFSIFRKFRQRQTKASRSEGIAYAYEVDKSERMAYTLWFLQLTSCWLSRR